MALATIVISSFLGVIAALIALVGFDVSYAQAFALYFISSIGPVAVVMAVVALQMQLRPVMSAPEGLRTLRQRAD